MVAPVSEGVDEVAPDVLRQSDETIEVEAPAVEGIAVFEPAGWGDDRGEGTWLEAQKYWTSSNV